MLRGKISVFAVSAALAIPSIAQAQSDSPEVACEGDIAALDAMVDSLPERGNALGALLETMFNEIGLPDRVPSNPALRKVYEEMALEIVRKRVFEAKLREAYICGDAAWIAALESAADPVQRAMIPRIREDARIENLFAPPEPVPDDVDDDGPDGEMGDGDLVIGKDGESTTHLEGFDPPGPVPEEAILSPEEAAQDIPGASDGTVPPLIDPSVSGATIDPERMAELEIAPETDGEGGVDDLIDPPGAFRPEVEGEVGVDDFIGRDPSEDTESPEAETHNTGTISATDGTGVPDEIGEDDLALVSDDLSDLGKTDDDGPLLPPSPGALFPFPEQADGSKQLLNDPEFQRLSEQFQAQLDAAAKRQAEEARRAEEEDPTELDDGDIVIGDGKNDGVQVPEGFDPDATAGTDDEDPETGTDGADVATTDTGTLTIPELPGVPTIELELANVPEPDLSGLAGIGARIAAAGPSAAECIAMDPALLCQNFSGNVKTACAAAVEDAKMACLLSATGSDTCVSDCRVNSVELSLSEMLRKLAKRNVDESYAIRDRLLSSYPDYAAAKPSLDAWRASALAWWDYGGSPLLNRAGRCEGGDIDAYRSQCIAACANSQNVVSLSCIPQGQTAVAIPTARLHLDAPGSFPEVGQ